MAASITTSTHLIVKGVFNNVSDESGNIISCSYIALPLGSNNTKAVCLSKETAGGIQTAHSQSWGKALTTYNDIVYFSTVTSGGTSIKSWDGTGVVKTVFTLTVGELNEIYTTNGFNFMFFRLNPGIGLDGSFFTGDTTNGFTMTDSYRDEPVILKNMLFTNKGSYNLDAGATLPAVTACRTPNYGSDYQPIQLQWQSNTYAYWIDRNVGGSSLCRVDINGTAEVLESTYAYSKGWRGDNTVLLLGLNGGVPIVTKIDLSTDTYSNTNLLASFGMLEVTSISGYINGIVLRGTDTFGVVKLLYYNTESNTIDVQPENTTDIVNVIPITL